jgi:hypothetical protein
VNDVFGFYHLRHDLPVGIARRYHLKQAINFKNDSPCFGFVFTQLLYGSVGKQPYVTPTWNKNTDFVFWSPIFESSPKTDCAVCTFLFLRVHSSEYCDYDKGENSLRVPTKHWCLEGTQTSPVCPSGRWVRNIGENILTGKTEVLGEKPVSAPLCPPQIPHGLIWDRMRHSAERGRRRITWDMA